MKHPKLNSVVYHTTMPKKPIEGNIYYNSIESTNYIYQEDGKWKSLTFHSDIWYGINVDRKKKIKNIYEQ
jgi:hypothetical protein